MFKQLSLACLCALSLPAMAQELSKQVDFKQDSSKFALITGKIDKLPNDTLITLLEPYTGDWDTVRVENHGFKIKKAMPKGGSMYILVIGHSPKEDDSNRGTIVYLEEGKLNITGKGDGFHGARISGSAWAKESEEVMAMVRPESGIAKEFEEVHQQWQKASQLGDEDLADSLDAKGGVLQKQMIANYKTWIKAHPNSGLSGYLITCYIPAQADRDELVKGLGEHALSSRIMMRYLHPGVVDESPMKLGFSNDPSADPTNRPKIGTLAPEITAANVDGKMVSLSDFRGKYVLVDFWASWCGPCKGQVPFLKAANDKFKDKNFVLLGVSLDNKHDAWVKAIEKEKLDWTQVSGLKGWSDSAALVYGISAIPANVLIGPDGKVVARDLYDDNIDKVLSATIH